MDGIVRISTLAVFLGVTSFVVGILPLSFTFSAKYRLQLSTFGNGLLLGAALGVIIPEGIEAITITEGPSPTSEIALSLLIGFAFMLVVEQYLAPHAQNKQISETEAAFQLSPVAERDPNRGVEFNNTAPTSRVISREDGGRRTHTVVSYPLTFGLVIHSLADGLALGASAAGENSSDTSLSLVVFFALVIHKAPAALGLTSSLLPTDLPRSEIRKHAAVFSAATPIGALSSFAVLSFIGAHTGRWTGVTLLISGGTFLYVATVIQPIGVHSHEHDNLHPMADISKLTRVSLLVAGIFLPFMIGLLVGHGHESGHPH